ncbi:MAG: Adenylate cyclase [Candidatus Rifleibacterium amylolyticum]|nr:MAG: Adenylate cyclase [Candidatus Rifleibacterium amylolyticum]
MREPGRTRLFTLLLAGLIVLAAPLCFFNNLIETAMHRSEDSAMGLLREKLLQESERVKELLTPTAYVRATIKKAHGEILPDVSQNLIKMKPAKDFGVDLFDERLPSKMLEALCRLQMKPLFITVASPDFSRVHYWYADELHKQCPEPDNLARVMAYELMTISSRLYQQYYQKEWSIYRITPGLLKLGEYGFNVSTPMNFKYLNRYGEIVLPHDTVLERFTDYFDKQMLYYYAYNCLSSVSLHGGYKIGVLQNSIVPREVLRTALASGSSEIEARLVRLHEKQSGFYINGKTVDFFDRPPTSFWSHLSFYRRTLGQKSLSDPGSYHLRLRAPLPQEIINFRRSLQIFRIIAGAMLLFYAMTAVYIWLFGFSLQSSIRQKLILLLAGIIFIPVVGSGLLAVISLKGSDRVIENHVMEKTRELLREFMQYDDENDNRLQLATLETKRRFEEYQGKRLDPEAMLSRPYDDLLWMRKLSGQQSILFQDGQIIHYSSALQILQRDSHKLINIILPKFFANLGLLNKQGNAFSQTLALGLSEDYITPEREASRLPHESTLQQEISHTLDTSRASIIVTQTKKGYYLFAFPRANDGDLNSHEYLSRFSLHSQKWFAKSDPYCDIELGARTRRHFNESLYAWPSSSLLNPEMQEIFRWINELKDSGSRIVHENDRIKTNAWNIRPHRPTILAAIGQSRSKGIGQFAISMIFPVLAGYAILLVMVLSLLFAEFIIKPVNIFSEGIQKLSNEEYGIIIDKFSNDEFSLMTSAFNKMSAALRQREMIKRLVSEKLIEQVEKSDKAEKNRTEEVEISVVASDIRGFTSISEKFSPSEVVELLNNYFTAMEKAISENHGVIDKYIGDAIQAVFYEKQGLAKPAERACASALAMRRQLQQLNKRRAEEGFFPLENGIGIATGRAVSGSIGSENGRKDFTIVGRITEQAANLESATINVESRILLCNNTKTAVAETFSCSGHDSNSWELKDGS